MSEGKEQVSNLFPKRDNIIICLELREIALGCAWWPLSKQSAENIGYFPQVSCTISLYYQRISNLEGFCSDPNLNIY